MKNEGILDVLADLRIFAHANDLGALAEQLDDARLIAATELASKGEGHAAHERSASGIDGCDIGGAGRGF